MKKVYRHGELLFVETESVPNEAKLKKTNTLLVGSGSNPHIFKGGKFYSLDNGIVFGYFEAKDTTLYHKEHGKGKGHATTLLREAKNYYDRIGYDFGGTIALNERMRKIYQRLNIKEYN
jgi:hypothetical protein